MGMFDYVTGVRVPCPKCGKMLDDFRSKNQECDLDTIEFKYTDHFYTYCDCRASVEYTIKRESWKTKTRKELTIDDYELVE